MSSVGITYCENDLVASASRSSRCVFSSVPIPNENTRVFSVFAFATFARIASSFVSPMVGCPSVRKMTT